MTPSMCPWFGDLIEHQWVPLDTDHPSVAQRCVWCDTWMFPTSPTARVLMEAENVVMRASE